MSQKHRSGVNFKHFIRDQIELYPFTADEAALVELIANSLDAKSTRMDINFDKEERVFQLADNGSGMNKRGFRQYHDFAMSLKRRGEGIGFAGLGAKLALWISEKVETETRSAAFSGCSEWAFEGNDLVWREVPKKTVYGNGTKTTFYLKRGNYPILKKPELERIIRKHYYPLLDPYLSTIYVMGGIYLKPVEFYINGARLDFDDPYPEEHVESKETFFLKKGRRRSAAGIGYFVLAKAPLQEELYGIGICSYGKVITRDFFGIFPRDATRVSGYVEAPYLSRIITTTKSDFIKTGAEGQRYYTFRREMQKRFRDWLEKLGNIEKKSATAPNGANLEKLIGAILGKLPELSTIFAARIPQDVPVVDGEEGTTSPAARKPQSRNGKEPGAESGETLPFDLDEEEKLPSKVAEQGAEYSTTRRRNVRLGPKVGWLEAPEDPRLSWVDGDTVVINSGHKAFKKAHREGFSLYHYLLAVGTALVRESAPATPEDTLGRVARFFESWGGI